MKIAAIYARVSSLKQQLNKNIASQLAALQQYAQQHDFQVSPQHIYQDNGYSGARWMVFVRNDALLAQPFDISRFELFGVIWLV
jgi:Resolvase, N terminal domain